MSPPFQTHRCFSTAEAYNLLAVVRALRLFEAAGSSTAIPRKLGVTLIRNTGTRTAP